MGANGYKGEVIVNLDGVDVTLRFTWGARATLRSMFGEDWVNRTSKALLTLDAGDMAVILDTASDGAVTIEQALESDWPLSEVAERIKQAFKYSIHGLNEPDLGDKERPNASRPRLTILKLLSRLLSWAGFKQKTFGN